MKGRLRNLFPRLSGNGRLAAMTLKCGCPDDGRVVYSCLKCNDSRCEVHRDNAHECPVERQYALEDRDKAVRRADALAVEVDEHKTRLAEVEAERDAMARDLIVLAHRRNDLRRMLAASPEQAYGNCLALSDRNEELRREKETRELRIAELEGRAAKPTVIEGGRLP